MRRVGTTLQLLVGLLLALGHHPAALGVPLEDYAAPVGPIGPALGYLTTDYGAEPTPADDVETSAVAGAAGIRTATAELVATTDTSQYVPPSSDPAGIVWIAEEGRLLVSDSEVNETPFFTGSNLFWLAPSGALVDHGTTTLEAAFDTLIRPNGFLATLTDACHGRE